MFSALHAIPAGGKASLGEIYEILGRKRIFDATESGDSSKFSFGKDGSIESNHEIVRPMVAEIMELKDDNADGIGPFLTLKFL